MGWLTLWTFLLLISFTGFVASANRLRFERQVLAEGRALAAKAASRGDLEGAVARSSLPAPVARYLDLAISGDRGSVRTVHIRHGGEMRTAPDKPAMTVRGYEVLVADPPGFVWWGRMRVAPGIWVDARDKLEDGKASMTIKAVSTITIGEVSGPELDEGAMLRILGEMAWLPTAFLDERYVTWSGIDETSARAKLRLGGREVSADFQFGKGGMPEQVSAERYRDVGGTSVLTPWIGRFRDYRDVGSLRVPFELDSTWVLETGPFTTLRFVVDSIEFDAKAGS